MSEIKEYTLTIFSENRAGIMSRIVSNITKRHINIESLSVSRSSIPDIHRFTIVLNLTEDRVRKLVAQIDKQVDILKAFYYDNTEIVYQEIALYKVPSKSFFKSDTSEILLRKHNARILRIEEEYVVIEKTGHETETGALFEALQGIGVYEFVRSGRVAIVKPMEKLNTYLSQMEKLYGSV